MPGKTGADHSYRATLRKASVVGGWIVSIVRCQGCSAAGRKSDHPGPGPANYGPRGILLTMKTGALGAGAMLRVIFTRSGVTGIAGFLMTTTKLHLKAP